MSKLMAPPPVGTRLVLSIDPGDTCGYVLAVLPENTEAVGVAEISSCSPDKMLQRIEELQPLLSQVLIERPPRAGGEDMLLLVGQILHAIRPQLADNRPNVVLVYPSVWKVYPAIVRKRVTDAMIMTQPKNVHERDAVGILAWWLAEQRRSQSSG